MLHLMGCGKRMQIECNILSIRFTWALNEQQLNELNFWKVEFMDNYIDFN